MSRLGIRTLAIGGSLALSAGLTGFAVTASSASAAPSTVDFAYTGAVQTWVVPAGVTQATFDVVGASGGDDTADGCGDTGGEGGRSQATIAVTPGQTISIYVGGQGGPSNRVATPGEAGFNGGGIGGTGTEGTGGGGGASDVRAGGTSLADRVIVAGGGGGVGAACNGAGNGGAGGGAVGTDGTAGNDAGKGGTATAGGAGANDAGDGMLGQGGMGGAGGNPDNNRAGGGGGGGLYGGGGGSDNGANFQPGGGGGGSGLCPSTCLTSSTGVHVGNGTVSVTFTPGSSPSSTTSTTTSSSTSTSTTGTTTAPVAQAVSTEPTFTG